MIVFQIHIANFAFYGVDAEGRAAVAGHTEAPRTFAIAGEDMGLPRRERPQLFGVTQIVKEGEHFAQLVHCIGRNAFAAVFRVEPL
jgi:hypothetical protein